MVVKVTYYRQGFHHHGTIGITRELRHKGHGFSKWYVAPGESRDITDQAEPLRQGKRRFFFYERVEQSILIPDAVVARLIGVRIDPLRAPRGLCQGYRFDCAGHQSARSP